MVQLSHFSQARGPDGNLAVAAELEDMQEPKAAQSGPTEPRPLLSPRLNSNFQKAWGSAKHSLCCSLSVSAFQPGRADAQPVCSGERQTLSHDDCSSTSPRVREAR